MTERDDLAGECLRQLGRRFELAAAATGGAFEQDLEMAGLRLRLRFAGEPARRALLPPFEHLAVEAEAAPELTVGVFDTASSGVEAPPPAWEPLDAPPGTNPVARLRSERVSVLAAAGSRALTAVEPAAGQAFFHLPDAERIPASERAAPLRDALQLLMAARDRWMTHAAAVGRGDRGVLLVGRGGSGKSTLALSCALAGMDIVADDYVLLEPDPPVAHAMQSTAKLTEDSAGRLGIPADSVDRAGFEPTLEGPAKALVDIRALAPRRLRRGVQIEALVAPRLGDRSQPSLWPVSAAEGLRAVAPSTIVQAGFGSGRSLAALGDLVRRVPSYALELSPDPAANAAAVDRLVSELG